jgi:hypothetical protein
LFAPLAITAVVGIKVALAEVPYQVFGVDVYFAESSPCGDPTKVTDLTISVAPFQQTTPVGEIVVELAMRAQSAGANMIHDIRIVSSESGRGTVVTAKATECRGLLSPHLQKLAASVSSSRSARIFSFPPAHDLPLSHTINDTKLTEIADIAGEKLKLLQSYLPPLSAPKPVVPIVPCRFVPTVGAEFSGEERAWWLFSYGCAAATLIAVSDDWTKAHPLSIDRSIVRQIQELAK